MNREKWAIEMDYILSDYFERREQELLSNEYECLKHFPKGYSQSIQKYAHSEVFNQYIFVWKEGKYYQGYCTHCNSEIGVPQLRHGESHICPSCRHECIAKQAGRGRKYMIDEAYFIYFEKSVIDPNVMVARGIYAVRDYSEDYRRVKTKYGTRAHYIFEMGNPIMLESYVWYSWNEYKMKTYRTSIRNKFNSLMRQFPAKKPETAIGVCKESVRNAVIGTQFQYSCYEGLLEGDSWELVVYFDLYARYPIIESLSKIGFTELVLDKLYGRSTYGAVNWNGKTVQKALRLNKGEIKAFAKSDCNDPSKVLRLYQLSKKDRSNLSFGEVDKFAKNIYSLSLNDLYPILKYTSLRKAIQYSEKQYKLNPKNYTSYQDVFSNWRDYIKDCIELQRDLKNEGVLFPKNLHKAHQETNKQIRVKASEELNKKIIKRAKKLGNLYFQKDGLFIRAAESAKELIDEGDALGHCVAKHYMDSYANGRTNILFVRKINKPDKPFYTVEVKNNQIIQCRSKGNETPEERKEKFVSEFMEAFKAEKLTKEKSENRVRVEIPA